ncbi:hypothetical protein SNEBB_009615 [Seison nebaliae]|nr:hypothetical protein SNEBB_009615 [Seison nebaliae]
MILDIYRRLFGPRHPKKCCHHTKTVRCNTLTADEIPKEFVDPFIWRGYRSIGMSFPQLIQNTMFTLTNETVNVWTHIIPSAYFIFELVSYYYKYPTFLLGFLLELENCVSCQYQPIMHKFLYGYLLVFITILIYLFTSAMAHLLNCRSLFIRKFSFSIDYTAISLYYLASLYAIGCYMQEGIYIEKYLQYGVMISVIMTVIAHLSQMPSVVYTKFYIQKHSLSRIRSLCFAIQYIYMALPIFYCFRQQIFSGETSKFMAIHLISAIATALIYVCHIPERFTRRFDLIGQSHQIMHIAAVIGSTTQLLALKCHIVDLLERIAEMNSKEINSIEMVASFIPNIPLDLFFKIIFLIHSIIMLFTYMLLKLSIC